MLGVLLMNVLLFFARLVTAPLWIVTFVLASALLAIVAGLFWITDGAPHNVVITYPRWK